MIDVQPTQRISELDGLRGLAASSVVLFHFLSEFPRRYSGVDYDIFRFGKYGVHLFFIISGFVIFMSMTKGDVSSFVVSRVSRLYPTYWAGVTVTYLCTILFPIGLELETTDFLINLTMLQAFLGVKHIDGSYWTLTYELVFYVYAVIVFISKENVKSKCCFILVLQFFYGLAISNEIPIYRPLEALSLLQYFNLFICGIVFYQYISKELVFKELLFFIGLILLNQFIIYGAESFFALSIIIIIFYLAISNKLKTLSNPFFVHLGAVSYSLYIVHQYIGYTLIKYFNDINIHQFASTSFAIIIVYSLAVFIHVFIEKRYSSIFKRNLNKLLSNIFSKVKC